MIKGAFWTRRAAMRRAIVTCLFVGSLVNAVPSSAAIHPHATGLDLIEDDLVGSGIETRDERPAVSPAKRLRQRTPPRLGDAAAAIGTARAELQRRDPGLADALIAELPRIQRDDVVGTMIRSGNTIRFNRTYVLSLEPEELLRHMWQLAVSLQSPY